MGWTGTHYWKYDHYGLRGFFQKQFGDSIQIIASAIYDRGKEIYLACKHPDGQIFAIIILCEFRRGYYNIYYKDMDETMIPYYFRAPRKILDLLTPTDNENALKWRANCWEYIREAETKRKVNKLPFSKGDLISIIERNKTEFYIVKQITIKKIYLESIKSNSNSYYVYNRRNFDGKLIKKKKELNPMMLAFYEKGIITS